MPTPFLLIFVILSEFNSLIVLIGPNNRVEVLTRNLEIRQIYMVILYLSATLIHKLGKLVLVLCDFQEL